VRPKASIVVFAKSVERLARFYSEVAELATEHAAADHAILDGTGFQVVIHGIPKKIAASIEIATPPAVRENNAIKLCLPVTSIEAARQRAAALGGAVGPKRKEWEARGFRACDGYDPEGNVFQVRESASRPSSSAG
jgi:predicted enzyme related to lactoylglutathione lyase